MITPTTLAEQAAAIHALIRSSDGNLRPTPEMLAVSLAQFFHYNVTKGGFAQLIYNLRGEYLEEVEQMLALAEAAVASDYYERALRLCAASPAEYKKFLSSDFIAENSLKNSLHELSIEYFRQAQSFEVETKAFVEASSARVAAWLQEHLSDAS